MPEGGHLAVMRPVSKRPVVYLRGIFTRNYTMRARDYPGSLITARSD